MKTIVFTFMVAALAIASSALADPPSVETKPAPAPYQLKLPNGSAIAPSSTTVTTGQPNQRGYSQTTSYGVTVTIPLGSNGGNNGKK